jgi:Uma2 family endonuclease
MVMPSSGNPLPSDLALVVDIADASLPRDRGLEKRLYALAGIPVYWIINLLERRCEVDTEPSGPAGQPDYKIMGRRMRFPW